MPRGLEERGCNMPLNDLERRVVNAYQHDFPLHPRPFAQIAEALGMSEADVLEIVGALRERGVLSRVGAVIAPNRLGASTLAAMSVPADRLEEVARCVSAHPEVNHNYEREHALNLWFVIAAADRAAVLGTLDRIAAETDLNPIELPLVEAYHIDLGFPI